MATVAEPPPGLLEGALGGAARPFVGRAAALRALPYHGPYQRAVVLWRGERLAADLDRAAEDAAAGRPDVRRGTDPAVPDAVAYHWLRLQRRTVLRHMLRVAVVAHRDDGGAPDARMHGIVDEYHALVRSAGRDARDRALVPNADALLVRAAAASAGHPPRARVLALVRYLTTALIEDVRTFRREGRRRRPRAPADDRAPDACSVCLDAPAGPRLPCGHKPACAPCTAGVRRCPLCRDPFEAAEVAWGDASGRPFVAPSEAPPVGRGN